VGLGDEAASWFHGTTPMHNIALTFGSSKEAALYFDHVVPLGLIFDTIEDFGSDRFYSSFNAKDYPSLMKARNKFDLLMPPAFNNTEMIHLLADMNMHCMFRALMKNISREEIESSPQWLRNGIARAEAEDKTLVASFLKRIDMPGTEISVGQALVSDSANLEDDISIVLSDLKLIDVTNTSMDQITEFRKDIQARQHLRRLRQFIRQNYQGKSKSFVEDDFALRLDNYEQEVRRWGFEVKNSAISVLINSKILFGAAGGSIIAALMGAPSLSLASIAVGTVLEAANVTLQVARKKLEFRSALHENPVTYIAKAREQLNT
jgi:hypothetical protein